MNFRRHRIICAIGAITFILIVASYMLTEKYRTAREHIDIFCSTFGLACSQYKMTPSLIMTSGRRGFVSSIHRINLTNESDVLFSMPYTELSCGDIAVSLRKPNDDGNNLSHISFVVGRDSESIEFYSNDSYFEMRRKYGYKAWNSNDVNWPPFMSNSAARNIINAIATKLKLPADMVFQTLTKDEKKGIWTAIWWRELNGYRYENDKVSVSIMGATGEFIEYLKTYAGSICPTNVNLSEDEALKKAWVQLTKHLPTDIRTQAHELYRVRASLRIIQPPIFGQFATTLKSRRSRLAWIINFSFTGGIDVDDSANQTEAERQLSDKAYIERSRRWYALGKPERIYEVRYDADSERIIERSYVSPSFLRWLVK